MSRVVLPPRSANVALASLDPAVQYEPVNMVAADPRPEPWAVVPAPRHGTPGRGAPSASPHGPVTELQHRAAGLGRLPGARPRWEISQQRRRYGS